jgi:hypothetical protein
VPVAPMRCARAMSSWMRTLAFPDCTDALNFATSSPISLAHFS